MEIQSQLISIPRTTNTNKATRLGAIIAFTLLAIGLFGVLPLSGAHAQTGVTSQVSVETLTNTGSSLSGYYVSLWQNGVLNGSCYSACAFTVTNGVHYQIAVSDYGGWCFSDWQGGNTSRYQDVYVTGPSASDLLKASYAPCSSTASGTSQLTVTTQNTNGNPISGYYTVLNQSSNVQATGFTPTTLNLQNGQTYTVQVDDYGSCHFDHWLDTASTTRARTVNINSATAYTAVMNCGGSSSFTMTITSADLSSHELLGYYIVLYQDGNVIQTGYTTAQFTLVSGQTYSIQADNYGSCQFYAWGGADHPAYSADPYTFTASPSLNLQAIYTGNDC